MKKFGISTRTQVIADKQWENRTGRRTYRPDDVQNTDVWNEVNITF